MKTRSLLFIVLLCCLNWVGCSENSGPEINPGSNLTGKWIVTDFYDKETREWTATDGKSHFIRFNENGVYSDSRGYSGSYTTATRSYPPAEGDASVSYGDIICKIDSRFICYRINEITVYRDNETTLSKAVFTVMESDKLSDINDKASVMAKVKAERR